MGAGSCYYKKYSTIEWIHGERRGRGRRGRERGGGGAGGGERCICACVHAVQP